MSRQRCSRIHHSRAYVREHQTMPHRAPTDLVGLPEAALVLNLHRATVNEMVHDGRLHGWRLGPHWYVSRADLEEFAASYERPKNSPRRRAPGESAASWKRRIANILSDWQEATADELAAAVDLHPGNIRKYLHLLERDGMTLRDEFGSWHLTPAGESSYSQVDETDQAAPRPSLKAVQSR